MSIAGMNESTIPRTFVILTTIVVVFLLAPVCIVVLSGLTAGDHLTFPPQGLSLRWIWAFFASDLFRNAYLFSLGLSSLSALISTVIGTMAAMLLEECGMGVIQCESAEAALQVL